MANEPNDKHALGIVCLLELGRWPMAFKKQWKTIEKPLENCDGASVLPMIKKPMLDMHGEPMAWQHWETNKRKTNGKTCKIAIGLIDCQWPTNTMINML